jgi:hypothetical protein
MAIAALNPIQSAGQGLWLMLAQSARGVQARDDVVLYVIVLVVAVFVIMTIGLIARKILSGPIESSESEAMFDLSELRRQHREGRLTDEEFQIARAVALRDGSGLMAAAAAPAPAEALLAAAADTDQELGPELLDTPDTPDPPDSPNEDDKPDPDPKAPDNPPNN